MRRVPSPPPGNLDALLSTITNAVAILLVLLAVTQLGVDDAVDHIEQRSEESDITRIETTKKLLADSETAITKQRQELQTVESVLPDHRKSLEADRKEIMAITTELQENELPQKIAAAKKQLDDRTETVQELEAKLAQLDEDAVSLNARLEGLPAQQQTPEVKVVSLPNPRPAAPTRQVVEIFCHKGRVVPYNEGALRKIAQERIVRAASELGTGNAINCEALKALFEKDDVGNAFFRLKVVHDGKLPELIAVQREDIGDTAESIESVTSLFQEVLSSVDRRNEWIRFTVFPDSFETYFAAREIASRKFGLSAGWQPREADFEDRLNLGLPAGVYCSGYKVPGGEPPKAKIPAAPAVPVPAVTPPKPVVEPAPNEKPPVTSAEPAEKDKRGKVAEPNTDKAQKRKGPLTEAEAALRREQRKAKKDALKKLKEKSKPPQQAPVESQPKEPPKATPPPTVVPVKPAVEPAQPAKPLFPNDDID